MKLLLKIVGFTCIGFVGLVILAFVALKVISDEQYKTWLAAAAESATGRQLAIDGPFELQVGTTLGLLAEDISFANTPWGSRDQLATVDRLFVEIRLLPLIRGVLDVTLELDAPDILLETNEAGQGNWVFASAGDQSRDEKVGEEPDGGKTEQSFTLPLKPYLRNLEIKGLAFVFHDRAQGKEHQAEVEHLRLFVDGSELPLTLQASYQGAPIELAGSLGRIEAWQTNSAAAISLTGRLNKANLSISGTAGPMLPSPNARLDLALTAGNIDTFSQFAGISLPDLEGLDIGLSLVAGDGRLATENIKAVLSDPRLMVGLQGDVANLTQVGGIDLHVDLSTEQGNELFKNLDLQIPYSLPPTLRVKGVLQGDLQTLSVRDLELTAEDRGLAVSLTGALENLLFRPTGQAALSIDLESTEVVAKYIGRDLPPFGPFKADARFASAERNMQLESLRITLADPALSADISGSTKEIGRAEDGSFAVNGIELSARAESSRLDDLAARIGLALPVPLPASFSLSGSAAGSLDQLAVNDVQASLKDEGIDVNLSGSVENALTLSGVTTELRAVVNDTADLSKFAGIELPGLGSLNLQARIASDEKTYRLDNLEIVLDGELIKAQLSGAVADLLGLADVAEQPEVLGTAGIDVSLKADTPSVSSLAGLAGVELAEIGALKLDAHLGSSGRSLALDRFNAILTQAGFATTATLSIADVVALSGVHAAVDAKLDSLAELARFTGGQPPQTGPWTLQVKADSDKPFSNPTTLSLELGGEGIKAVFAASIPDIKAPQTFETELTIAAESMARVAGLLGREAAEDKPLKISGRAAGKPGDYRISEFLIEAGESTIMADLAYLVPPAESAVRKSLSGHVSVRDFDFSDWLTAQENEAALPDAEDVELAENKKTTGRKLFSSEPLSVGVLHEYDIDLKIDAANVKLPRGVTLDGKVAISLDQGLLKLDPFSITQIDGGSGNGYLKLDARNPAAQLEVDVDFDNFVSYRFGGQMDLNVDLGGSGESVAALMGSLNGHFAASVRDVELKKTFMSNFGAGLLSQLNPLDSDTTVLECAVVRFDITDGIADFRKKIAAQTKEVTWLGGGKINLKTEELDVGISPKPRGALNSLTNVNLASLVHVGGTLAEPKIGLDPLDVAVKYGEYTAFIATGGLSFLAQKAYETTRANMDHCERILAELGDGDGDRAEKEEAQ